MARKHKGKDLSKKGLKGALACHNLKEETNRKKQKALDGTIEQKKLKTQSMKSGSNKSKKNTNGSQASNQKGLIPFEYDNTLLLVGEGDFSFAVSIIKQNYINPQNLIATSYDSLSELKSKYPDVDEKLSFLESEGVKVIHEVDANKLVSSLRLDTKKGRAATPFKPGKYLNYIMFNFPHTGRGMKDVDRNIMDHQKLVVNYFKSCKDIFKIVNDLSKSDTAGYNLDNSKGKILMSLFEGEPYKSWGVKILAKTENYKVEKSGRFDWEQFPEYHHKRTNGVRDTTKPAAERDARIYIFDEFVKNPKKESKESDSDED